MPIKDILLPLVGEPTAGRLPRSTSAWQWPAISAPGLPQWQLKRNFGSSEGNDLGRSGQHGEAEAVRSVSDAHGLLKAFDAAAARYGVRNEQRLNRLAAADIPANFAASARLKDLSLIPVKPDDSQSEKIVERLIFGSGRPILMCPEEFAADLAVTFDHAVIAWDHSAPAARAVADALPMLQAAASVRIITATDNKTLAELESGAALVSHLAEHGIKAAFETVKIDGSSIGKVFERYVAPTQSTFW